MKKRILITDDSSSLRSIISRYLSDLPDCEFLFAGDGAEAERLLQEGVVLDQEIHLIILDWMMPNITGFQFLKKIREIPAYSGKPKIIMLTAETYASQAEACLKYNVTAYLTKPFSREELRDVVEKVLAQITAENEGETRHAV